MVEFVEFSHSLESHRIFHKFFPQQQKMKRVHLHLATCVQSLADLWLKLLKFVFNGFFRRNFLVKLERNEC